ncbi:phosphatidylserine synthase [Mangrovimonas yunxiaonensis]|uniref:Phosphatidylserine synthase n=1 Tax=Mangrovimonas yunxiaonensis TaxID=1197477 RepID=A0A084TJ72_9FLAO|nr:CDP-alcohol phosphatidyltransferase family protein [Mangrovimonas yunxiaonensis]KFB00758.1 phosphatidylserine synthase [Mangrovimonas yunxiaonensis]MBR9758045.1 phosphatidylserine synthase [Algicola sp.]GGH45876.1 phosphatidylserine synthase [Mangrovimonas yunxiaonensis]
MKKHLPNALTLLNLLCGCFAVVLAVNNNFVAAGLFVFAGIFFDFFDGLAARALGVQSALGVQLDSLADMVTSGLVPGIVMFKLLTLASDQAALVEISGGWEAANTWQGFAFAPIALLGFLITLASAYRLAKFNIDEDQQTYFKGLPTPANALLILSLPMIIEYQQSDAMNAIIVNVWTLVGVTLVSSYLLVSPIKLFALKFKTWGFKPNAVRYIFIILSLVALLLFQFAAIPLIVLLYFMLSLTSQSQIV